MTARPHELADALHALERTGALTRGALAQQLDITELDAHILMLTAETNRLVYKNGRGRVGDNRTRSPHPPPTRRKLGQPCAGRMTEPPETRRPSAIAGACHRTAPVPSTLPWPA